MFFLEVNTPPFFQLLTHGYISSVNVAFPVARRCKKKCACLLLVFAGGGGGGGAAEGM